MRSSQLSAVLALDREATGEDRSGVHHLARGLGLGGHAGGEVTGFHLACPWGGGPTIARDAASGLALLRLAATVTTRPSRGPGLPRVESAAVRYLADLAITADRYVTRMWLGTPPAWRPEMIFGVFNFGVA